MQAVGSAGLGGRGSAANGELRGAHEMIRSRLHWKPTVEETDAKGSVEPKKIPSLVSCLRHVT
jgi:hypothetical protein